MSGDLYRYGCMYRGAVALALALLRPAAGRRIGGILVQRKNYKSTIDEYEGNVFRWDARGNQLGCNPHKDIATAD